MSSYNLDSKLQSQEIYLDSRYATINPSGDKNSDVYFFFQAPINVGTDHDVVMRVDNFVCPISFFIVNSTNNLLNIEVLNPSRVVITDRSFRINDPDFTALLTEGTFTPQQVVQDIRNRIDPAFNVDFVDNRFVFSSDQSFWIEGGSLMALGFPSGARVFSVNNQIIAPNPGGGAEVQSYEIPEGNYNALTLRSQINDLLEDFQVDYDSSNNGLTFSRDVPFTILSSSTCLKLIGFFRDTTATLQDGFYVATSPYQMNLAGSSLIYIDVPTVTTRNISARSGGGYTTIVKSIVSDVPYGAILSYVNNTTAAVVLKEKYISYLQIRLLDDDFNLLDLNGQHFTLTIEFFFYFNGTAPLSGENLVDAVRQQEHEKQKILSENK